MFNVYFSFFFLILSILMCNDLKATTLRVGTYNLWNPIFEEKYSGQNSWNKRYPYLVENILLSKSDLLCLEEVGKTAYLDLMQNSEINSTYLSFYIPHAPSKPGQESRDGLAFFYNPEKVTLMKFVVSLDGSRPTHRRDFYVDIKLNEQHEAPVKFRMAGTHLDSERDLTIGNTQLSALVEDTLRDQSGIDFAVICGDFNEGEDEPLRPRAEIMRRAGFITDGSIEPTRPEALNVRHKGHVDWVYLNKLSNLDFTLIPVSPLGDENASDHKLTLTDILIMLPESSGK